MYNINTFMNRTIISIIVGATLVLAGLGATYYFSAKQEGSPQVQGPEEQTLCTMEAKQCPDGSFVGRQGPRCEFSPCPDAKNGATSKLDEKDWKTETQTKGLSFKYPETLSSTFIGAQEWPPVITVAAGKPFSCKVSSSQKESSREVEKSTINGREYCIETMTEGAAGSTYTTYTYSTPHKGGTLSVRFTLRYPQCANYDEPNKSACESERSSFDIDGLIDRIVKTVL